MKDTDLELSRHLLTQWIEELLDQRDDTVEGLLDSRENRPDPLDRASAESERAWTLRIRG